MELSADQFFLYYFRNPVAYIIHPPHPLHGLISFKLFGNAFPFGVLFYQPKKEGLCFFLYICKVGAELAGSEQIII